MQRCTPPVAGEQWRWHQWYIYQVHKRAAYHLCLPFGGWRNPAPDPAASWLDMWTWDHGTFHGQGLHPCLSRDSGWSSRPSLLGSYHCWKQPLQLSYQLNAFLISIFQHLGYDARRASSLAAFHLAQCFANLSNWHTGRRAGSWGHLRELIDWPLKLDA